MSNAQKAVAITPAVVATATCRECTNPSAAGHTRCQRHLDLHRKRTRQRRSRERKQAFPPTARRQLLDLIASGTPLTQACQTVGVAVARVHALARIDARWARQLDDALLKGRDPDLVHGTSSAYKLARCRCPECRKAKYVERGPRRPPAARGDDAPLTAPAGADGSQAERATGRLRRPNWRLTAQDRDVIRREWEAGTPPLEIAWRLEVAESTVTRTARRLGLPQRGRQPKSPPSPLGVQEREQLRRMWAEGKPTQDIARVLGIHQGSVYHYAQMLGLPARPRRSGPAGLGERGDHLLVEMWLAGEPIADIARELGLNRMTVLHHVERLDLPKNIERPKPAGRMGPGSAHARMTKRARAAGFADLEAYFTARSGVSVAGIARELGVHRKSVQRWQRIHAGGGAEDGSP